MKEVKSLQFDDPEVFMRECDFQYEIGTKKT